MQFRQKKAELPKPLLQSNASKWDRSSKDATRTKETLLASSKKKCPQTCSKRCSDQTYMQV
eukprot:1161795-Pelagomonas_calceolata.AAC.8